MMSEQPYRPLPQVPFRIGATSYVIEADLVANALYLADKVQDMQLVLFDLPDGPSNLPSPGEIDALTAIASDSGLTYTVHLIEDLRLSDGGTFDHPSLHKAQEVIALTQSLKPWAYVLHLDGRTVQFPTASTGAPAHWHREARLALAHVTTMIDEALLLAVENLEGYAPDFVAPVVDQLPVSRCVDIGHLWRDFHDPLPWLVQALPRTRVVHLHGVQRSGPRTVHDHQSLRWMRATELDAVVHCLMTATYLGVLTLEVFGIEDFTTSLHALAESTRRYDPVGA